MDVRTFRSYWLAIAYSTNLKRTFINHAHVRTCAQEGIAASGDWQPG